MAWQPMNKQHMIKKTQELTRIAELTSDRMIRADLLEWRLRYLMRSIPMRFNIDLDGITPLGKWSYKCKPHEVPEYYNYARDHYPSYGLECNDKFTEFIIIIQEVRSPIMNLDEAIDKLTEMHK